MTLKLNGSTDGSVSIDAPADTSPTGSDITLTLPTTVGSANQFVKNGGTAGELEYSSMVEDSSGRLLVGPTTARSNILDGDGGNTLTPYLQVETANDDTAKALSIIYGRNNSNGAEIVLGKHRNASVGGTTIVNDGDQLGSLTFSGSDGTNFRPAATIEANVDATPGSSDMPGRLVFSTTADGASSPTERTRIDSSGRFLHGLTSPSSSTVKFEVAANVGPDPAFKFNQTATSGLSYDMFFSKTGYAPDDTSSRFLTCSDTSATRLIIRSDGDVLNHDNTYGSLSDVSLKQQIVDASSQWDDIKDVRVRKFKMNSDVEAYGDEAGFRIGVIAQELEQTSPGLVKDHTELDGTILKSVSYSVLYMKAIKALQEAQTRIETLETQHADLLARVTALEAAE